MGCCMYHCYVPYRSALLAPAVRNVTEDASKHISARPLWRVARAQSCLAGNNGNLGRGRLSDQVNGGVFGVIVLAGN